MFEAAVLAFAGLLVARNDARRLTPGVLLLAAAAMGLASTAIALLTVAFATGILVAPLELDAAGEAPLVGVLVAVGVISTFVVGALVLVPLIGVPILTVVLIANGFVMLRRERPSLANLLSLALGLGLLLLASLSVAALLVPWPEVALILFALFGPAAVLGFLFLAFLLWQRCYGIVADRAVVDASAVIVLGAGLDDDGEVTPLLAGRIRRGVDVFREIDGRVVAVAGDMDLADEPNGASAAVDVTTGARDDERTVDTGARAEAAPDAPDAPSAAAVPPVDAPREVRPASGVGSRRGRRGGGGRRDAPIASTTRRDPGSSVHGRPRPVLVLSGGQGDDEPRPEATAMADHAHRLGLRRRDLLEEDASRTTHENVRLSRALLAERGIEGEIAVVTSDYHAFRAATLLRAEGIAGHAVGSRTAGYYWPSAILREFAAIVRDRRRIVGTLVAVSCLPAAALIVVQFI